MKRILFLLCVLSLTSCQDKVICPAFQSTYILDDSTRNAYFSYVWQLDESTRTQFLSQQSPSESSVDSLSVLPVNQPSPPKTDYYAYAGEIMVPWRVPERTKYGIVKPVFMPIKKYRMRTAPMENIFGPEPVSNNLVAADFADSVSVDSLSIAEGDSLVRLPDPVVAKKQKNAPKFFYGYDPSDNFNVEQLYYNKYFAEMLIDNRPEPQSVAQDTLSSDSTQSKEPFFKRLFKMRNKDIATDSLTTTETVPDPSLEQTGEEEEGNE